MKAKKKTMEKPITTNGKARIVCQHCGEVATYQLIYSLEQVAHLLKKSRGQILNMLREKKIEFRYELKTGWAIRRVVDYHQLWDYIDNFLPRPKDLESTQLNPTKRAIKRILEWERHGQKQAKLTLERKRAKPET